ncbi:transmembrane protein 203-like [Paramacrobiotus metropolitanus]|uniref:transmembrane protein 203-like n=1 Tax=Paramacrobiotus metropolitanus TaxID=2943436 RepID=UPI0024456EB3|nr:transmembrane protein 203-like [Paramacrobiotus metropolitanus]XP_055356049.1 transmembrane protein 203-like [Paramacrobiotus metropolitanus]
MLKSPFSSRVVFLPESHPNFVLRRENILAMFFTIKEACVWTGMSPAEMLWHILCLCCFTILLCVKLDSFSAWLTAALALTWWRTFLPLFVGLAVNAYFVMIVLIRSVLVGETKKALHRSGLTMLMLAAVAVFYTLVCQKLEQTVHYSYPEIMAPFFIIIVLTAIRANSTK